MSEPARDRPDLDGLVALVAVRARRARRDAHHRTGRHLLDVVAEPYGQRPGRDHVDLLDLLVVVAGPLLEVRVRRDPDQGHRQLLGLERPGEPAELTGDVGAFVVVVDVVGGDDRVVAHHLDAMRPTWDGSPGLLSRQTHLPQEGLTCSVGPRSARSAPVCSRWAPRRPRTRRRSPSTTPAAPARGRCAPRSPRPTGPRPRTRSSSRSL